MLTDAWDLFTPVLAYLKKVKETFLAKKLELNVRSFKRVTRTEHVFSTNGLSKVVKKA